MAAEKNLQGLMNEGKGKRCPGCKGKNIVFEENEIICKDCGLVIE